MRVAVEPAVEFTEDGRIEVTVRVNDGKEVTDGIPIGALKRRNKVWLRKHVMEAPAQ